MYLEKKETNLEQLSKAGHKLLGQFQGKDTESAASQMKVQKFGDAPVLQLPLPAWGSLAPRAAM